VKIVAISMVRNEGDVIEAFVRHHAEIVDQLVVVDHRSADGTDEIVLALAAEGLPVRLLREDSRVQRQNEVMTSLMRDASTEEEADWVLPLDADEFLTAPGASVRAVLGCSPQQPLAVDMRPYVPTADDPRDEPNPLRRICHRRRLEHDTWTRKVLVPRRWARDERYLLAQGNHVLLDRRTGEFLPTTWAGDLALAHLPVRSADQLARKVLGGWPAHVARPDRAPDGAFQWKRVFDLVVAGERLDASELEAIAFDYPTREPDPRQELILDPIPVAHELRYPLSREPTPIELLAQTAVELAEELSEAVRSDPAGGERQSEPAVGLTPATEEHRLTTR
jgi:hypothetical protein